MSIIINHAKVVLFFVIASTAAVMLGTVPGWAQDTAPPTVSIDSIRPKNDGFGNYEVRIVFSERVQRFESNDVLVTNGTALIVKHTDNTIYGVRLTPDGSGDVTVSVPAGAAIDGAALRSTASNEVVIEDIAAPSVTLSPPPLSFCRWRRLR